MFPLANLQNDHSLTLCNSDSLCIPEEEPDYGPTARSKILRRFLFASLLQAICYLVMG